MKRFDAKKETRLDGIRFNNHFLRNSFPKSAKIATNI